MRGAHETACLRGCPPSTDGILGDPMGPEDAEVHNDPGIPRYWYSAFVHADVDCPWSRAHTDGPCRSRSPKTLLVSGSCIPEILSQGSVVSSSAPKSFEEIRLQ